MTVRVSAKELTSLILDEDRLRSERSDRKLWKTRVTGIDEFGPQAIAGPPAERAPPRRQRTNRNEEDDAEMRLAIEASKHEAEEEKKRRAKNAGAAAETDDDLAKALRLSKEEEELRRRQLEDQNAASLFDDTPEPSQPQPTGYNQGYQQQTAVDWFGNPIQQPQSTGYLNNQYAQQPQQTGFQNGYQNGFGAQPTGYDGFGQQPNYLQQQNTIQPQQTSLQNNNPYGQQPQVNGVFGQQSPQQQQQQQQQQQLPQPGSHNPWVSNQTQAGSLQPIPTGSNNPFAQKVQQQPQPSLFQQKPQPSLNTLYEQQPTNNFTQPTQPNPIMSFSPQPQPQKAQNPQHARLNALLASGEGQDTFGNTGDLRIPAQHTAPGTFVNSAGGGMDRLRAAQTGNNPFFQQQFTGAGPNQPGGFTQQMQMPAQTGPAGGFGAYGQQNNNPFGNRQGQGQSSSLIDL